MSIFIFLKNSILGLIAVGFKLSSSLVLNKVIALYFGPAGLVQLAHFQNLLSFFTLIPNDGVNRGLMPYLAKNQINSHSYLQYLKAGLYLTVALFAGTTGAILIGRKLFLPYFPAETSWLILFLIGAGLLVLQSFFNAVLLARQRIFIVITGNCLTAVLVVIFVVFAHTRLPLSTFLTGYLFVMSSLMVYFLPWSLRGLSLKKFWKIQVPSKALKQLSNFILMALSVLLFTKGLDYYIRDYMIRYFSLYQAGLWQGVVRLSDSYTAVFSAVLAYAFYPKVASLVADTGQLKIFVKSVLKLVLPVLVIGLILVYSCKENLLTGLLSGKFIKAQYLMLYQLVGDFFKLTSWVLANILVAQSRVRVIVIFEGISALAYLGCFYFFTDTFGVIGSTMAHCANYFFFLALHLIYFRKLLFT